MNHLTKQSFPEVVAHKSPFQRAGNAATLGVSSTIAGASRTPYDKLPGVFMTPQGSDELSRAVTAHEYGHLYVDRKYFPMKQLHDACQRMNIIDDWLQAGLDVVVNNTLLRTGEFEEIHSLVDHIANDAAKYLANPEISEYFKAAAKLRATGLNAPEDHPLTTYGEHWSDLQRRAFDQASVTLKDANTLEQTLEALTLLQMAFGPWPPSDDPGNTPPKKKRGRPRKIIDGGGPSKPSNLHIPWGDMIIVTLPLTEPVLGHQKLKDWKPSFVGAFRFPSRALLPVSDGRAFGKRRAPRKSTILLDMSGSMSLTQKQLQSLIKANPDVVIAGYSGNKRGQGNLAIISAKGKCWTGLFDRDLRKTIFPGTNEIDGPALTWLGQRQGERAWICDGVVTGVHDEASLYLDLDAQQIITSRRIPRYNNVDNFLQGKRSMDGIH